MTLKDAAALFATKSRLEALKSVLEAPKGSRIALNGLAGSAPAMLLSQFKPPHSPSLIIADDIDSAGYIYNDLNSLTPDCAVIFPSGYKRNIRYGQVDEPSRILRMETLEAVANKRKGLNWIVTCPEAIAEKVADAKQIKENTVKITVGKNYVMTQLATKLRELGFTETDYVYEPGQFALRGSILDIYSYAAELPYRIDFFDDEVDSIRTFNIETQLSESKVKEATIIPAIDKNNEESPKIGLLDFLSDKTVIFCESPDRVVQVVAQTASDHISSSALTAGEGDMNAMQNIVDPIHFSKVFYSHTLVDFSFADRTGFEADYTIDFRCSPQTLYHKNFELISESFIKMTEDKYHIFILSDSTYQTERLKSIFEDRGDNITFTPVDHTLHNGFIDHESKNCFLTDHQIFDRFHKYSLKSDRARSGKLALSIKELNQIEPGDYIVHTDHGIGKFGGLIRIDVNGHTQEMIKLLYQNDDIILVSIHGLHKLSKYRGKEGIPPKISKLGTGAWNKLKDRTKAKLKDIARDLIKLYAARREEKGHAFAPDSYLQHELEASFIYEDTPDQLKATAAVKADMESQKPMDRLICGDVGFGKTEIAVRAAFKAAADSMQTAVLVPTTVLALQHYQTFSERLKDLPVRVEFLSRAKKPKEVKQILNDLETGKIDILIGTHKIIGNGVKFKNLGLLIIDEEQKFGVAVKEKLKQLKVNVDTLTMSATPIPRTLQFSLMGARDLSSLNTPPANRHPIVTTVTAFDDDTIKEAVNFELSRNGQIFFIANRIEALPSIEATLRRLIPDIRIITAHGRMKPENVEKAILDFKAGDYDVLLSTTIIENGIDMPNVNTIIINNAQNFGISELHQLRGRVGRSNRKAFCYLLIPPATPLTPIAHRRLQAIESFSELGAGIQIAMQDLDIRGAGNLLGAEQSGFIADLGYETYQKILKEAVLELKTEEFADTFTDVNAGEKEEFVADCVIESDLELRLPPDYVPQENERISLYRQLDNMERLPQIDDFRAQLRDRFGKIPHVTDELINIVPLRIIAKQLGIERIGLKAGRMRLYFVDTENKAYYNSNAFGKVLSYIKQYPRRCHLKPIAGRSIIIIDNVNSVEEALTILNQIDNI